MPILHARPCWSRFLEFDTSISGTTWWMLAMAMTDLLDVLANPRLMTDLEKRCRENLRGLRYGTLGALDGSNTEVPPWKYTDEPIDKWSAFAVAADRFPGQSIIADCDDLVGPWGAFWKSRRGRSRPVNVGVAISQPKTRPCCTGDGCGDRSKIKCGHGMAHTYNVLDMPDGFVPSCDYGGALINSATMREWLRATGYERPDNVWIWDGSVAAGMRPTSPNFYGSGETAVLWMVDPTLLEAQ